MIKANWQELHKYDCSLATVVSNLMLEKDVNTIPTGRIHVIMDRIVRLDWYQVKQWCYFQRKYTHRVILKERDIIGN